jgi:predicted alpha/beta hydrolase family esterase
MIYRDYQVVLQHHWLNHWQQRQRLLLVVEQQLIEHSMLDNTKQLHQKVDFVENQVVELLIEVELVAALLDPRTK